MAARSLYHMLEVAAKAANVDLLAAIKRAGHSDAQFYRWRSGATSPRAGTFGNVMGAIDQLKRNKVKGKTNVHATGGTL